jgi:hypothetical protein
MAKKKKERSTAAKLGAQYTAAKHAATVLSPLTDVGLLAATQKGSIDQNNVGASLHARAMTGGYAGNLAVNAADAFLDRKFGQAAALTRGSVTALVPEGYLALASFARGGKDIRAVHSNAVIVHQGYDPATGQGAFDDPNFRTYRLLKHGGQILRRLSTSGVGKKVLGPVKDAIGMLGGSA